MPMMKHIGNSVTKRGKRDQLRYLSHSVRLQESLPTHMARLTLGVISLTVFAFIGWAAAANVNEVARVPGEVTPQGFQQVVQHLEGGIVQEILVEEGMLVNKGDVLLRLSGTGVNEDLGQVEERRLSLELQAERLKAFIEDRKPDFSKFSKVDPAQIENQKKMYQSMLDARQSERDVLNEQIRQKQNSMRALQSRRNAIAKNLDITNDLLARKQELYSNGYVSKIGFLETQQDANALSGENQQLGAQIEEARAGLKEYKDRLSSLDASYRDDAWKQLESAEGELAQNSKIVDKLKNKVDRLDVTAPERGLVKSLSINTVGGVVAPGQTLMEIVPLDRPLIVDVRIMPRHIGHLRVGQPVQVKISSFDYSRYGAVPGELEYISASTFQGEQGERYYRGRVRLSQNYVGNHPDQNIVMPGMTVMADMITGDKTILQYLLKPIQNSIQTAMSER